MKFALYYPWIYLTSGAERSILELVRKSRHDWTVFTHHYDREHTYPGFSEVDIRELDKVSVKRSFLKVIASGIRVLTEKIRLEGYDGLLVVCEGMGDLIVFRNHEVPVYCLCLTPLRPVFDRAYREVYLSERGMSARVKLFLLGKIYSLVDRMAWRHYRKIMCISGEAYRRVLEGKLAPENKLSIAYPGIDYTRMSPTGKREKLILVPGRIMWTKNIELGLRAFRIFRERGGEADGYRLVIAGIVDKKSVPYYEKLRAMTDGNGHVEFVVNPSDEDLFALYDRSSAVMFTPFNEDWGMVPLEAMAYGKPVIAVKSGGPLETVKHEETGFLAEPDPDEFAKYLMRIVSRPEEARRMGKQGRDYVKQFDWRYFVEAVDNMLDNKGSRATP